MGKNYNSSRLVNGLSVDSNGNVGINTTSPSYKLDVNGTGRFTGALGVGAAGAYASTTLLVRANSSTSTNWGLIVEDNASNQLFGVRNNGNVGIGTGSPTEKLSISGNLIATGALYNGTTGSFFIADAVGNGTYPTYGFTNNTGLGMYRAAADTLGFVAGGTERMRITSAGNVCINTSSKIDDGLISIAADSNLNQGIVIKSTNASNNIYYIYFKNSSNAAAGRIEQTGSTSVSYASGSDYRLKEDLKDFDGLNKVLSIKTYDFKWKNEDKRDYGVLAHELQEVVSGAVLGQKDELEEDGTIKTQMVDYSKLTPLLVKAIQELKAEIDILKSK